MPRQVLAFSIFCMMVAGLFGCQEQRRETQPQSDQPATQQSQQPTPAVDASPGTESTADASATASARLQPTQGNQAQGLVTFIRRAEGVEVIAELQGLSPGKHGFHVHETGDCSAPDASSAGDHYNPEGAPHGAPDNPAAQRHAGDLGNIEAGPDGTARYQRVDPTLQLSGPQSIVGKALLVHAGADDLTSQPAGDSGPRIACGVIEMKQGQ